MSVHTHVGPVIWIYWRANFSDIYWGSQKLCTAIAFIFVIFVHLQLMKREMTILIKSQNCYLLPPCFHLLKTNRMRRYLATLQRECRSSTADRDQQSDGVRVHFVKKASAPLGTSRLEMGWRLIFRVSFYFRVRIGT